VALERSLTQSVVHTRLDRMEECVNSAHLVSLFATSEFFSASIFEVIGAPFWIVSHPKTVGTVGLGFVVLVALIALAVVWILYQVRTRLVLAGVIIFVLLFTFTMYGFVTYSLSYDNVKFIPTATVSSWLAFSLLAYTDYQLLRAAWNVSRVSDAERSIVRGKRPHAIQGYLLQLFGIPAICQWLDQRQRRISVALFFLSTSVFCFFVQAALYVSIGIVPMVEIYSGSSDFRDLENVFGSYSVPILLLALLIIYSAAFALALLLVAGSRYAARRFTRLSLERLSSSDPRPHILFLRSFRDDQVRLRKSRTNFLGWLVSVGEPRPTLDHVLLEEGTSYGPVVAIGRPGSTPPFGAARKYVNDAEWRETVGELCRQAGAVVITLDETEGVRWELQHLLGQDHVPKTLFLLPPRLTPPSEVLRVLPTTFGDWRDRGDWIDQICAIVAAEGRHCLGWFWRDDGQLELLTTLRNSSSTYLLAVRSFLNRGPDRFAGPPPLPHEIQTGADAEVPRRQKAYVGSGIMIATCGALLSLFTLSLPSGFIVFTPLLWTALAWWGLSRTRLPFALIPTLSVTLGQCLWGAFGLMLAIATGKLGNQNWGFLISFAIALALAFWVIAARSRKATIALLVFQTLNLLEIFAFITLAAPSSIEQTPTVTIVVQIIVNACAVAASIYGLVKLNKPSLAYAAAPTVAAVQSSEASPARKRYLDAGLMITIGAIILTVTLFRLPNEIRYIAPLILAGLGCWSLSRARLPSALIPTLGISLSQCLWGVLGTTLVVAGDLGVDTPFSFSDLFGVFLVLIAWVSATNFCTAAVAALFGFLFSAQYRLSYGAEDVAVCLDLAIFAGLIGWVIVARSLRASMALLLYQVISLVATIGALLVPPELIGKIPAIPQLGFNAALYACEVAASIYAIVKLKQATFWK
jgi:hypothetical protein